MAGSGRLRPATVRPRSAAAGCGRLRPAAGTRPGVVAELARYAWWTDL